MLLSAKSASKEVQQKLLQCDEYNRQQSARLQARRGRSRGRGNPAKRGSLRQDRRVFGPVWRNCVIPSANRVIHDNASSPSTVRGLRGFRYAVGNSTLFDGPFQFLRSMHEYRVTKVTFDVNVITAPKCTIATHPVEVSSIDTHRYP